MVITCSNMVIIWLYYYMILHIDILEINVIQFYCILIYYYRYTVILKCYTIVILLPNYNPWCFYIEELQILKVGGKLIRTWTSPAEMIRVFSSKQHYGPIAPGNWDHPLLRCHGFGMWSSEGFAEEQFRPHIFLWISHWETLRGILVVSGKFMLAIHILSYYR